MKKWIWATIANFILSAGAHAFQNLDTNITGGFGLHGSRGIIGISGERFFSENHAVALSTGLDLIGVTGGVGYRYFTQSLGGMTTTSQFEKCFFIFDCDTYLYAGPSLQYAAATTLKISDTASERVYKIEPKWLGLASFGSRFVFKGDMSFDLEVSYRSIFLGGRAVQTAGPANDDQQSIETGFKTFGLNIGLGYVF